MVKVAIVKGGSPAAMVREALRLINAEEVSSRDDKVLIKPNYVVASHPSTGITTDTGVVEALIKYFKEAGVKEIVVGEGGAGDTEKAFDVVGVRALCARERIRLVNLNRDDAITVRIPNALSLKEVNIAKTVLESTCIVNVPVLKVHHLAFVTLCIKNLMGAIIPKSIMHTNLDEKLVDLASVIKPKINLISGIVGAEKDETRGDPVEMGIIIAGRDIVATDAVGAMVMGIDPYKVRYLRLAEERRLGVLDINRIEVVGESIEAVRKEFKLPPGFSR